jgi:hypothetical protein
LLARIGGKRVPRASILVEYEASAAHPVARHSRFAALSEKRQREKYAYDSSNQSFDENFSAGKTRLNVKEMPQHCGDQRRSEDSAEKVSHPNLDRVHG